MTDLSVIIRLHNVTVRDGSEVQVRRRHVLQRYPTEFLSRISNAFSNK
jgi:hypothetical protein